jgi:hypothetical protein
MSAETQVFSMIAIRRTIPGMDAGTVFHGSASSRRG